VSEIISNMIIWFIELLFICIISVSGDDVKCKAEEQVCEGAKECIYPSWICDGEVDCSNGWDELGCEKRQCKPGEFRCRSGQCIDGYRACNQLEECNDKSDEMGCDWSCTDSEFQCAESGRCIPLDHKCDGDNDCSDGGMDRSDEENCGGRCKDGEFFCSESMAVEGDPRCIPGRWKCDGSKDCHNGEDERKCSPPCPDGILCDNKQKCVHEDKMCNQDPDCDDGKDERPDLCHRRCIAGIEWACGGGPIGYCINSNWKCDGSLDCQDGSDESEALCGGNITPRECSPGEFQCDNGICIAGEWQCDKQDDCDDASDEKNCGIVCGAGQFMCALGTCISLDLVCDGSKDCENGMDEMWCLTPGETCTNYKCKTTNKCLPYGQFCDQRDDCGDMSDEQPNCERWNNCTKNNGGCEHTCTPLEGGTHECGCNEGYHLGLNRRECLDTDECNNSSSCSQYCTNTEGSFTCDCEASYQLGSNGRSCYAKEIDPFVVYSNLNHIRRTNVNGTQSDILFPTRHSNIIDFDYINQLWYWVNIVPKNMLDPFGKQRTIIERTDFNQTNKTQLYEVTDVGIYDLAVDWVSNKLYWTVTNETGPRTVGQITVLDLQTSNITIVVERNLYQPRAIVLDPVLGLIFWTEVDDMVNANGRIERCNMDGTQRKVLQNQHITRVVSWANGITLDYVRHKVIWIDAGSSNVIQHGPRVEEMNYDGSNRRIVKRLLPLNAKPWSITMFEDWIYWTDSNVEALLKANRLNASDSEHVRTGLSVPMAVKVVHPLRQPVGTNYCTNTTCPWICLLKPNGYACHCPLGLVKEGEDCVTPVIPPPVDGCVPACTANYTCLRNSSDVLICQSVKPVQDPQHEGGILKEKIWILCIVVVVIMMLGVGVALAFKRLVRCKLCLNQLNRARQYDNYPYLDMEQIQNTVSDKGSTFSPSKSQDDEPKRESDI